MRLRLNGHGWKLGSGLEAVVAFFVGGLQQVSENARQKRVEMGGGSIQNANFAKPPSCLMLEHHHHPEKSTLK